VLFSSLMNKLYTTKEAALLVGVSVRRIRQLATHGEIEHRQFGRDLIITEVGINQAKTRKTKPGPAKNTERRKAA